MRRVLAANRSLTVAAPILALAFPATFDTNFMMQVLTAEVRNGPAIRDRPTITSLRLLAVLDVLCRGDVATNGDTARKNACATSGRRTSYGQASHALRLATG